MILTMTFRSDMTAVQDIAGRRFGRLVAQTQSGWHHLKSGIRVQVWKCICDCGAVLDVKMAYLKSGDTSSCGCLRRERTAALKRTHGMAHQSSTYDIWVLMRQRCNNPKANGFRYYGGKGVAVCKRWDSFEAFLQDMGERPPGMTLDRIDPSGNYELANCRWATWETQNRNKRNSIQTATP